MLADVPLPATSTASLPGASAVVACEGFLRRPDSYGWCHLGGVGYYFPLVTVRCAGCGEADQVLAVEFSGPLLEKHREVADMAGQDWPGLWASGRLRCPAREGGPPDVATL